jgi:hypothetical protein
VLGGLRRKRLIGAGETGWEEEESADSDDDQEEAQRRVPSQGSVRLSGVITTRQRMQALRVCTRARKRA